MIRGQPDQELEKLCKEWSINRLTFEVDTEPYSIQRDETVEIKLKAMGLEVIKCVSHTLYDVSR